MTKNFDNYLALFESLKGLNLDSYPSLLFFYNATANSLGCNCDGKIVSAKNRYKSLVVNLADNEKRFLKQHLNVEKLELKQDNEIFLINL